MKVLIIGLRGEDSGKLKALFSTLSLKFIDSQSLSSHKLKGSQKYDRIISVTKFTRHVVEYVCGNQQGFIRLRPTQGYSTVKLLLEDFENEIKYS